MCRETRIIADTKARMVADGIRGNPLLNPRESALRESASSWKIQVERTQLTLASMVRMAVDPLARVKGLLGRDTLPAGEALVFPECHSIHTVGMRFPIDAIFVDKRWRVVALRPRLGPGRLVFPVWNAWGVVEMASGALERVPLQVGDQLNLLPSQELAEK